MKVYDIKQRIRKMLLPCLRKHVILTFDDGPHLDYTPVILDVLRHHKINAVFFVLGERMQICGARELMKRALAEGHLIGNHGFSHVDMRKLSPDQIRSEILRTREMIAEFESEHPLFRPPYGAFNSDVVEIAKELGYQMLLWNVDPQDWNPDRKPTAWIDAAIDQMGTRRRSICICHDSQKTTAEGLDQLMTRVRATPRFHFARYRI
jgi:peptidoglycan/xylan/chitin deacetylase (PgdA/CDA1 family)